MWRGAQQPYRRQPYRLIRTAGRQAPFALCRAALAPGPVTSQVQKGVGKTGEPRRPEKKIDIKVAFFAFMEGIEKSHQHNLVP